MSSRDRGASSQTGAGAAAGAAVGAVAGGLGGAVRGAGAGAVAGKASNGNTRGEKVKVPAGTLVEFTLDVRSIWRPSAPSGRCVWRGSPFLRMSPWWALMTFPAPNSKTLP